MDFNRSSFVSSDSKNPINLDFLGVYHMEDTVQIIYIQLIIKTTIEMER